MMVSAQRSPRQRDRLPKGGRIDRAKPLTFRFNGRVCGGYAGDSLASALLANGIRLVGRSLKYRRPRGILGCGAEEPNAIVQVGSGAEATPNLRATEVELRDGLAASTVRGWPSLGFDLGAVADFCGPLLAAGFYYKTFMRPRALWKGYERLLRKAAGLGVAPPLPDPDCYAQRNAHCDVLVVGAGPAGLMAALAAARAGARVMLADAQWELGGSLLFDARRLNGAPAADWLSRTLAELASHPEALLLPRTTVFGYYDQNFLAMLERCGNGSKGRSGDAGAGGAAEGEARRARDDGSEQGGEIRQRLWRVRAKRVVLAQGACERPLALANNDRPGLMLASAVSQYIRRYAVLPGRRGLVFTNNDSGYRAALDLAEAGAEVVLADSRLGGAGCMAEAARRAGIELLLGYGAINLLGRRRIRAVQIAPLSQDGKRLAGASTSLACDLVALSGGWNPSVHLHCQAGGKLRWREDLACFVPGQPAQNCLSAGAANGAFSLAACLEEGWRAGLRSAELCGFRSAASVALQAAAPGAQARSKTDAASGQRAPRGEREAQRASGSAAVQGAQAALGLALEAVNPLQSLWRVPEARASAGSPKQFLDYQNDTTVADVRLAVREGYRSLEHVKRYAALGFGTDQGKLGNVNGIGVLAECLNRPIAEIGVTAYRPPYTPIRFGAGAGMEVGQLYDPVRKTPLHEWHEAAGAVFEPVGQWLRPRYFPKAGEDMAAAVDRECLAARRALALMDASTLGKIEVQGPDAAAFLDRIYTQRVAAMKIGRCAYGLMLGEDGMLMDDGVVARLDAERFYLTTTTGGAATVLDWLERWLQTEWPDLRVRLTSVTERWGVLALAGPNARRLLQGLDGDIDFRQSAFPFMSHRAGALAGLPVRVFRVSFSGELAYEINVQSDYAPALWQRLMKVGEPHGIAPFGTEAMHVLRAEKGFVIVGQDTDGSVTPLDLGMKRLLADDKDFLGKRSLARPDCRRGDRQQWVGLLSADGATVLPEGTQLIERPWDGRTKPPIAALGHVTSSYWSPCLGHPIALGLVRSGRSRQGATLSAALGDGRHVEVRVAAPIFYDPQGERQRA